MGGDPFSSSDPSDSSKPPKPSKLKRLGIMTLFASFKILFFIVGLFVTIGILYLVALLINGPATGPPPECPPGSICYERGR